MKITHGWRPAALGAAIGLAIGFAGGAGAGLLDQVSPSATSPSALPSEPDARSAEPSPWPSPAPALQAPASSSRSAGGAAAATLGPLYGPTNPSATCGAPGGRIVKFRVLVERGLPTTPARFVDDLRSVLCDRRSWIASGKVRFRYDPNGSLLIGLRTPASSERRCMQVVHLSVRRYYSCGSVREIVLNSDRWFKGSDYWPGTVAAYRQMLVNHETGHALGQRHRTCTRNGSPAPVMMQQSKGMTNGGHTCTPNPWPLGYELRAIR